MILLDRGLAGAVGGTDGQTFAHVEHRYWSFHVTFTGDVATLPDATSHSTHWVHIVCSLMNHTTISYRLGRQKFSHLSADVPREGSISAARASFAHIRSESI